MTKEMEAAFSDGHLISQGEPWKLVERYVNRPPGDWVLVFKRGATILEVPVPEEVWRAFDLRLITEDV